MIVRRLSAFFTLLAFAFFAGTYLLRKIFGFPVADVTAMFSQGVVVIIAYFVIGMFLAKMGIALVNEVLEARRQREEDKRERARNLYLSAISGTRGAGLTGSSGLDLNSAERSAEDSEYAAGRTPAAGAKK